MSDNKDTIIVDQVELSEKEKQSLFVNLFTDSKVAENLISEAGGIENFNSFMGDKSANEITKELDNYEFYALNKSGIDSAIQDLTIGGDYEHSGYALMYHSNFKDLVNNTKEDEDLEKLGDSIKNILDGVEIAQTEENIKLQDLVYQTANEVVLERIVDQYQQLTTPEDQEILLDKEIKELSDKEIKEQRAFEESILNDEDLRFTGGETREDIKAFVEEHNQSSYEYTQDDLDDINRSAYDNQQFEFSAEAPQDKDLYSIRFYVPDYDFPNLTKENLTLDQVKENVSEYGLTQGHFTLHDSQDRELLNVERTEYQRYGINKDPELFVQVSQDGYKRDPEVIDLAIQSITQAGKQYGIEPIFLQADNQVKENNLQTNLDDIQTKIYVPSEKDEKYLSLDQALQDQFTDKVFISISNQKTGDEIYLRALPEYDTKGQIGYSLTTHDSQGNDGHSDKELFDKLGLNPNIKFVDEKNDLVIYSQDEVKKIFESALDKSNLTQDFKEISPIVNTIENDTQKVISNKPVAEQLEQIHEHYKTSLDGVDLKNLKQGSFIYAVDTNTLETQQLKFTEAYNLTSVTKLPLVGNTVFDKDLGDYRLNHDLQPKEVITKPLAKEEIKTLVEDNIKAEKQLGITDQLKEKLGFEDLVPTAVKTSYLIKAQSDKDFTFYDKSDTKLPAFEAHKNTLSTTKEDQTTISAMLAVAKSQNWDSVKLTGTEEFRREAWLQASLQGLQVKGYTPKESDMMELKARNELLDKNTITGSKTPEKVEEKTPEAKAIAVTPEAKLAGFTIAGKLLDYGYAPYPDKPNSKSFFIEVEKENGSKEKAWGIALADQLNKAGAERGDNISMTKLDGQKADILVPTKIKDGNGQVIGIEDKPHQVQAWNVSVIEKDKEKANKPIGDLYVPQELDKGSTHAKIADHRENLKHQMDTLKVSPEITSKVLQNFDTSVKTGHAVEKLEQLKPKAVEFKEANKSDSKERDR